MFIRHRNFKRTAGTKVWGHGLVLLWIATLGISIAKCSSIFVVNTCVYVMLIRFILRHWHAGLTDLTRFFTTLGPIHWSGVVGATEAVLTRHYMEAASILFQNLAPRHNFDGTPASLLARSSIPTRTTHQTPPAVQGQIFPCPADTTKAAWLPITAIFRMMEKYWWCRGWRQRP